MARTDNHRNSGSRRVNMKIWGGVPSLKLVYTPTFMSIGTTAIELRVFKKKKKKKKEKKMGKTFFGILFIFGALLLRFLEFSHSKCHKIIKS